MKSIFRQKVNVFYPAIYVSTNCGNPYRYFVQREKHEQLDIVFFECDIDLPELKIGDSFYIDDMILYVNIKNAMRNSNGGMVYYIDDIDQNIDKYDELEKEAQKQCDSGNLELKKQRELKIKEDEENRKERYNKKSFLYKLFNKYDKFL